MPRTICAVSVADSYELMLRFRRRPRHRKIRHMSINRAATAKYKARDPIQSAVRRPIPSRCARVT
ncbi:MAG: hypothetical protein ACRD3S_06785, partial [Terracidiphilus sp.]